LTWRRGCEAVLVGIAAGQSVSFDPMNLQSRGLTIKGTIMAGRDGVPEFFIRQLIGFWKACLHPPRCRHWHTKPFSERPGTYWQRL
jgi:hypothetical protein